MPRRSAGHLARGFALGLLLFLFLAASGHARREAYCTTIDCPPCGPRFCYDPAAARPLKEAKKAYALSRGLPERLAKAFDEIADCVGCVEMSPDWPHLVVEMDHAGWERVKGRPAPYNWNSAPWSAASEKQARDMMREGLVKSIHVILARYPCRCCPQSVEERQQWHAGYPDSEIYWQGQDGWNDDLDIHDDVAVEKITDPSQLGEDPRDLTEISERDKRPPVDLAICGGAEVPKVRHVTVSCTECMPIKDEHDKYADWINDTQTRIRALKRGVCILNQVISGVWGEINAVENLARTPQTQAQLDGLYQELADRHADQDRDLEKIKELEANIREFEARRQEALVRLAECEEQCRKAAAEPRDQLVTGQDPELADETPKANAPAADPGVAQAGVVTPQAGAVTGDGNGDGVVNEDDYNLWRDNFGSTGGNGAAEGDYNGDGTVDAADYVVWRKGMSDAAAGTGSEGVVFNRPVEQAKQLNPTALSSFSLLPLVQDGSVELGRATRVSLNPGPGPRGEVVVTRPGRGADEPAFSFDEPVVYFETLGGSTGEVLKAHIVNPTGEPLPLEGYAALEPVAVPPSRQARIAEEIRRAPGEHLEAVANFYCLEFLKQAPPAGVVYRIAGAAKQERFAPMARALESARRLYESGGMAVEGDPGTYFHSIRQWAVWTLEQSFDQARFVDAFTEHARKNFARMNQPWSEAIEAEVRRHGERRWLDVRKVIEGAQSSP